MKAGDTYTHFKGNKYIFVGIALPKQTFHVPEELTKEMVKEKEIMYHENTHEVTVSNLWGIYLIDSDIPHVIYQSEKEVGTDKRWAREIEDFFGCKEVEGKLVKKFVRDEKKE